MTASTEKQCKCRLCGDYFSDSEMSEEHYPARNTGNEDIVAVLKGDTFSEIARSNKCHKNLLYFTKSIVFYPSD